MEQNILNKIGVDTDLLNKEPIHTRENCLKILGVSDKTLKKYEDEDLLRSSRFKRKKYYTPEAIIDFVRTKLNLSNTNWDKIWE